MITNPIRLYNFKNLEVEPFFLKISQVIYGFFKKKKKKILRAYY